MAETMQDNLEGQLTILKSQMEKIDEKTYKKYFSMRRENSKWSEKNKELAKRLEE